MSHWGKKGLVLLVVGALILTLATLPVPATEQTTVQERTTEEMIFDFVFLRPLGMLGTIAGSAVFVLSLPFSGPEGNAGEAARKLVVKPARFTFARPLGQSE